MRSAVLKPSCLLIIDDHPGILDLVQTAMEGEGYSVTPASSLPTAISFLSEELFHLILTDLFRTQGQPPLLSIGPLLREAGPIPVGILTAWNLPVEAATQAGAAFLLHKPFEFENLLHVVQQEVSRRPRELRQAQCIEQFFAALNAGDWSRLVRLCTPDVAVVPLSAPPMTVLEARRGLLSYRTTLERRFLALPGYPIEAVQVFDRPLGVTARYTARWSSRDGDIHRLAGSMRFHFEGECIAQIEGAF